MAKFKKGDRVVLLSDTYSDIRYGEKGTVDQNNSSWPMVKWDNGYDIGIKEQDMRILIEEKKPEPLSRRDQFAMAAMQGLLANSDWMSTFNDEKYLFNDSVAANVAVQYADALIQELDKKHP